MSVKRITIRVSPILHERATQAASKRSVSLNEFVVAALEDSIGKQPAQVGVWPLLDIGALLAPAAQAQELSQEQLLDHLHDVRRRLWEERYRQLVEEVQRRTT